MIVRFFVHVEDRWYKHNKKIILSIDFCVSWKDHWAVSVPIFYSVLFVTIVHVFSWVSTLHYNIGMYHSNIGVKLKKSMFIYFDFKVFFPKFSRKSKWWQVLDWWSHVSMVLYIFIQICKNHLINREFSQMLWLWVT